MALVPLHLRLTALSVVMCALGGCAVPWWRSAAVSPRDFEAAAKETPPANATTSPYGKSRDELTRVESQYGRSSDPADAKSIESKSSDARQSIDENKQALRDVLGQLKAQGAIDDTALAEMLKSVNELEPSMVKHLTWMYRATLNDLSKHTASAEPAPRAAAAAATQATSTETVSQPTASTTDKPASKSASTHQPKLVAAEKPVAESIAEPAKAQAEPVQKTVTAPTEAAQTTQPVEPTPLDFTQSLARSITALEKNSGSATSDKSVLRSQALLRMLYLTAGRREDALRPIEGLNETEQEFWTHQLYALSTYLDDERLTDPMRRSAEASRHLDQAARRLHESAGLTVRNLTFCSAVSSYGVYTPMSKGEVKPGQQLLLYAEVENFTSRETPQGYHTALKARYQILDAKGTKADEHEFPVTEEHCQNPRRDYFVRYFLTVPQRLYDGKYTLQVTVEDTLGNKVGQGSIDMHVKQQPK